MSQLKKVFRMIKNNGIKQTLQYSIKKCLGIDNYDEQFSTLFYFLNLYENPSGIPTATGNIRELQLCDLELLRIVEKVLNKYDLDYWLDWGTLLGAVRHKGFIPWDDDLDISMPRASYEKARFVLEKELKPYGFEIEEKNEEILGRIGVGYKHYETGIWLDIFPIDICKKDESEVLIKKIKRYQKIYLRKKAKCSRESLINLKKDFLKCECDIPFEKNGNNILFSSPEFFYNKIYFFEEDEIYPLETCEFEGSTFKIPRKYDDYLKKMYGNNYMKFPKTGIEHHGNNEGSLKTWAERNGINMKEILTILENMNVY